MMDLPTAVAQDDLSTGRAEGEVWPRVAIVLVNWNGWRDCLECLNTVWAQDWPAFDVFLVDNRSADGSLDHIRAWCAEPTFEPSWMDRPGLKHWAQPNGRPAVPIPVRLIGPDAIHLPAPALPAEGPRVLTLVDSGGNLGFAGGNNVGIRVAGTHRYDHFWLLNTDTVIARDALRHLVLRAQAAPGIGMVGSTLMHYGEPDVVQAFAGAHHDESRGFIRHLGEDRPMAEIPLDPSEIERHMAYVIGASMLVPSAFVQQVGPMQEDYFLYYEEYDWAMRGAAGRWTQAYAPKSLVWHKGGATSAQVVSLFSMRMLYRNRLKFTARFFPHRLAGTRRSMAVELLRHVLKGRWVSARAAFDALRLPVQADQPSLARPDVR